MQYSAGSAATSRRAATLAPEDVAIHSVDARISKELDRLAARSASWAEASAAERVLVAKEVLECLKTEPWDETGWLAAQCELQDCPGDASTLRFIFGSVVKDFLETFVDAHEGSSDRGAALLRGDAVKLGAAVPGATLEFRRGAAPAPDDRAAPGTVTLVLGAGNQSFLTLIDALDRCFLRGECVLVKHHPLRPWLDAPYGQILAPLAGLDVFAQVADAGVEEASALVADPRVGHVHLTGSEATRDAVRRTLDAAGKEEVLISAELGCATPWLVAPGDWTDREIRNGARALVAAKKANGGSNCLSPQAVLLASDWPQRAQFLAAVRDELKEQPDQKAYYPGAAARRDAALEAAGAAPFGEGSNAVGFVELGWVETAPREARELALETEAFGPFLAVATLAGGAAAPEAGPWLEKAAKFASSDAVTGSLSCSVLAPESLEAGALERAIDALDFGSVAVNVWSVFGYTAMAAGGTWGAHPTDSEGRSGRGVVGNHYGVPDVEKVVLRAGTLSKPAVDLAAMPPAIVYDALYAALVRGQGVLGVAKLLGRRLLGKVLGGGKFGAPSA